MQRVNFHLQYDWTGAGGNKRSFLFVLLLLDNGHYNVLLNDVALDTDAGHLPLMNNGMIRSKISRKDKESILRGNMQNTPIFFLDFIS